MKASYLKFFVSGQRHRLGLDFAQSQCRHEFGYLVHQKRVGVGLLSFRANCVASISAETDLDGEEIQAVNSDQLKTVRVKFKLRKQCGFGQHFLVVGDDPNLGLWSPSDGVPLNWSEGHVWTAQVDIPSSKVINYKFILKEISGTVSWQSGPDRVLATWDTANTISVTEDWDIPESQIIDEEEVVDDLNVSGSFIAENLQQIVGDDVMEEQVAENVSDLSLGDEGSGLMSWKNETGLVMDGGVPVLVPGLSAMPRDLFSGVLLFGLGLLVGVLLGLSISCVPLASLVYFDT